MSSEIVFAGLVAGRLLLALAPLPGALKYDHQLSSPLTSHLRLQEGIFLYQNDIDPYSGSVFRHSPLLLSLFSTVLPTSSVPCAFLWTLCDALSAYALVAIWRARQRVPKSTRDGLVAASYLLNPYLFLPTLALSTSTFENMSVLLTLMFASQGRTSAALLALAFATHLSLSSILLLVPVLLLLITAPTSQLASPRPFPSDLHKTALLLGEFVSYSAILTLASTIVAGGWSWVPQTWGASLSLPDLTPNPGLWWYFFTEMFDHFRPFFLMVFSVHLLIYIFPICIKFQHDLLYAAFLLLGVLATFKAYLTLADPGLFLSMIVLFPEIYPYTRHPIVTTLLHLHAALLLPLFHHLWISQGTGNANFFYASTLVFGMANGAALVDCMWAGLRIAVGEAKEGEGWEVVQE
ncbi:PIG-U-domain-containing protein [Leucogyrophana mollusca]|uniref:PIG-U-domain-containing protein n=1 Tax=Leucogyrophana mollusca TaxID=85980 RepID=A0ACB8BK90_9AGAM|nr:PIG-U-domain-containing protein [Leucogyrophana mollusca]